MHEIQQQIIYQLILRKECRYRDIKPKDVEGNLFMYHLRQLFKDGLAEKTSEGRYRLTTAGLRLADTLSLKSLKPRIQPKIVTLLALQNDKGEWLLYRRNRQPFFGLLGFPYGKIHLGESIHDAALRELEEKTGLTTELTHQGDTYLTVYNEGELLSQMFCHVFVGISPSGKLRPKTEIGECMWTAVNGSGNEYMPGFLEILALLKSKDRFFKEITVRQTGRI